MEQQNSLRDQIAKEEQRNVYLSQLLKSVEEKLAKVRSGSEKEAAMDNRAELEIAQMKNLDKRIEIYKHELEKLKGINTANVVLELRRLRGQMNEQERKLDETKKELAALQEAVNKMRARNMGKQKNREMEKMYGERKYEIRILHKRLRELENEEYTHNIKPPRKSARSLTQIIKEKETAKVAKPQQEKKGKIDKYAMYKNLIRFYTQEEEKLKKQIQDLTKEVAQNKKVNQNIQFYQQKIATLIQKKVN